MSGSADVKHFRARLRLGHPNQHFDWNTMRRSDAGRRPAGSRRTALSPWAPVSLPPRDVRVGAASEHRARDRLFAGASSHSRQMHFGQPQALRPEPGEVVGTGVRFSGAASTTTGTIRRWSPPRTSPARRGTRRDRRITAAATHHHRHRWHPEALEGRLRGVRR